MSTQFPFVWSRQCRSKRMDDIVTILAREPFLSIREIGHRLGLKKTPYLREMMIELVGQERVVYEWLDEPGQLRTMVFRVFHHEDTDPPDDILEGEPETDNDGYLLLVASERYPEQETESGFPSVYVEPEDFSLGDQPIARFDPDWPLEHADPLFVPFDDPLS